jgi:hypothetical protein
MESFLSARAAGKLVAALLEKRKPLARLKEKSAAVAVGMLGNQCLDDFDNFLLLRSRQLRHRCKYAPDFPDGAAARFWRCDAVKLLDGNIENFCQLFDLLRAQGNWIALPGSVAGLVNLEFGGDFGLRKSQSLAGFTHPLAKRSARAFGWSASLHADTITAPKNS